MNSIILLGAGGHCKSCIDVIEKGKNFYIKGIVDKDCNNEKLEFMGYKILGDDTNIRACFGEDDYGLVCVGQIKSAEIRIKLFSLLKNNSIKIATVKSKYSLISDNCDIDEGTIIMHNCVINSGARIGRNCIVNTNSIIEHDVFINDHSHISTGVIVNGHVQIGQGTFIGSGVIIKEGVSIGDKVLISAGEIVLDNISSGTIYKTSQT